MAIDGTDPEELREILESEVYAKRLADKQAAKFFADAGAYAPTIGIIGTVMGLVHVLENLAAPAELGHLIAGAFIATLWGVTSANVIFLPLGNRLKRLGELEAARMEVTIEGIAAIQAGSNPRVVAQKLRSLLPGAAEARGGLTCSATTPTKCTKEHENHERWLVTYADMVTLLMVLFIVMFAMSVVDEKKFNMLKEGLAAGFGQPTSILRRLAHDPRGARHRDHRTGGRRRPRRRRAGARAAPRSTRPSQKIEQRAADRKRAAAEIEVKRLDGRPSEDPRGGEEGRPPGRRQHAASTSAVWWSAWSPGTWSSSPTWPSCRRAAARSWTCSRRCSRRSPTRCRSTATPTR